MCQKLMTYGTSRSFVRSVLPSFFVPSSFCPSTLFHVRSFVPSFLRSAEFLRSFLRSCVVSDVRVLFPTSEFLSSPSPVLDRRVCWLCACVLQYQALLFGTYLPVVGRVLSLFLTHSLTHCHETSTLSPTHLFVIHPRAVHSVCLWRVRSLRHRALFQTYPLRFLFCVFVLAGFALCVCFVCGVCCSFVFCGVVLLCCVLFFSPPVLCLSCCGVPFLLCLVCRAFYFFCCRAVVA